MGAPISATQSASPYDREDILRDARPVVCGTEGKGYARLIVAGRISDPSRPILTGSVNGEHREFDYEGRFRSEHCLTQVRTESPQT